MIRLDRVSKRFGRLAAVDAVSLDLREGEILGLAGDNGAGKSTLMKIPSGALRPDAGTVRFDGRAEAPRSPREARRLGVDMIYQDLALVDALDVAQNVFLGREMLRSGTLRRLGALDVPRMRAAACRLLAEVGIPEVPPDRPVADLSGGERQAVAVCRAIASGARITIMDEPTAALSLSETEKLLALVRGLRDRGVGVVLISHRLDDLLRVCDRIAVLRHGRLVADRPVAATSREEIVAWMFGTATAEPQ